MQRPIQCGQLKLKKIVFEPILDDIYLFLDKRYLNLNI